MATYLNEYYASPAYGTAPNVLSSSARIALPRARPIQKLYIEVDCAVVDGALAGNSPEALFSNITLKAGADTIVDMDGAEARMIGSALGFVASPKQVNVITTPKCLIVIPFGVQHALRTDWPGYNEVTLTLTLGSAVTRIAATSITTMVWRVFGLEQDYAPPLGESGRPLTRRFLRTEQTVSAAGDQVIDLLTPGLCNGLLVTGLDARTTALYTLDQTNANNTRFVLSADLPGQRPRLIDCHWKSLMLAALEQSGINTDDLVAAIGGTSVLRDWIGAGYIQLGELGAPIDLRQATRFYATVTAASAGKIAIVRDIIAE